MAGALRAGPPHRADSGLFAHGGHIISLSRMGKVPELRLGPYGRPFSGSSLDFLGCFREMIAAGLGLTAWDDPARSALPLRRSGLLFSAGPHRSTALGGIVS